MLRIETKPWFGREDGRLVVWKGHEVVFSTHYRNLQHRKQIVEEIQKIREQISEEVKKIMLTKPF